MVLATLFGTGESLLVRNILTRDFVKRSMKFGEIDGKELSTFKAHPLGRDEGSLKMMAWWACLSNPLRSGDLGRGVLITVFFIGH